MGTKKWLTGLLRHRTREERRPPEPPPAAKEEVKDLLRKAVYGDPHEDECAERGRIKISSLGGVVHVNFGNAHLVRGTKVIEVRDPISRKYRRVDFPRDFGRQTTFYGRDGKLYDGGGDTTG